MVSTAARASATVAAAALNLLHAGSRLTWPSGHRAARGQGLQARRALGQRIERARFAAQRVLRLERHALDHQAELLRGRRHRSAACGSSSVSTAAPARHATISASSTGNALILGDLVSRVVIAYGPAALSSRPVKSSDSPPNSSNSTPATPRRRGEMRRRDSCRSESPSAAPRRRIPTLRSAGIPTLHRR